MRREDRHRPRVSRRALAWVALGAALAAGGLLAWRSATERDSLPPGIGVAVRGHREATLTDGLWLPRFFTDSGAPVRLFLCLHTEPGVDTSRWTARLTLAGRGEAPWKPPALRMEPTLCFDQTMPAAAPVGKWRFCGTVRDEYDGRTVGRVCRWVWLGPGFAEEAKLDRELLALGRPEPGALGPWLAQVDALRRRAGRDGFFFSEAYAQIQAIDQSRQAGTADAFAEAGRRLAALPAWLDQPVACYLDGLRSYERALLAIDSGGSLRAALDDLERADELYLRIAHRTRLEAIARQAEILSKVGDLAGAERRLRQALGACTPATCTDALRLPAQAELAWILLLDPDASAATLAEAESYIRQALADPAAGEGERINQWVNLAYLEVQRRQSPAAALAEARRLAAPGLPLLAWADLVEARWALASGDPDRALALCSRLAQTGEPRLAAWALSCAGRAYRGRGEFARALGSFERALVLHEYATPEALGQRIPLGLSQRSDDFYQASRAAVEAGRPGEAWELLDRLDSLAASEEEERRCQGTLPQAERARLLAGARRRDELLSEITRLEAPTSGARLRQLEASLWKARQELEEISRALSPCGRATGAPPTAAADYRAVPLDDEVLLLARSAAGEVTLAQRRPINRRALRQATAAIARELDRPRLSDEEWRRQVAPLAALVIPPGVERAGPAVRFALHGPLQEIPLQALPVPGDRQRRWLADLTTIVVHPAVPAAVPAARRPALLAAPLFVVDPEENLHGAAELADFYRSLAPGAEVLAGGAATRRAFEARVAGASLLHVDAHGEYDPAFPELSSLRLAGSDRVALSRLAELRSIPRGLVNLSGCKTGGWPVTADSGRYGLAGLLARRGTSWVVASRSNLGDRIARDFNRAFYAELSREPDVRQSFERALAAVRRQGYRAVDWGGLLLLSGAPERQ